MFRPATLLKKRLWHSCFLVKFAKFLRTPLNTFEQPKKGRPKFSSAQIFVTLGKFRHLGPTNNLGRRKFGFFVKFHKVVTFVFKYDISSFRLVNSHYLLYLSR